jgi:alpha-D-ribose 1-methylphosphonate 5-triphosphate diphosphatase PhnM
VGYAAVTSAFAISDVLQQGFQQAFTALAMQVFMGEPNDLVVHTASALEIDPGTRMFSADQQYRATIDHSSYFQDAGVQEFIRRHFAG